MGEKTSVRRSYRELTEFAATVGHDCAGWLTPSEWAAAVDDLDEARVTAFLEQLTADIRVAGGRVPAVLDDPTDTGHWWLSWRPGLDGGTWWTLHSTSAGTVDLVQLLVSCQMRPPGPRRIVETLLRIRADELNGSQRAFAATLVQDGTPVNVACRTARVLVDRPGSA
jgi:hypothetical protein